MDTPQVRQSLRRLAHVAALHSQRYLLSGYSLTRLREEQVDEISTQMLRLFERCYEEAIAKSPPDAPGGTSDAGADRDIRSRQRGR